MFGEAGPKYPENRIRIQELVGRLVVVLLALMVFRLARWVAGQVLRAQAGPRAMMVPVVLAQPQMVQTP